MTITHTTRKGALGALGVAIAASLVLAPAAAQAHVGISADGEAVAGGESTLTFGFNHGCDDSPTTSLAITMPDGLSGVHPVAEAGWTVDVERGGDAGRVSTVTYTADEPVPADLRGEVQLLVGFADGAEGTLAFPVEQTCEDGATSWSEIAADGEDPHELEAPAPTLELAAGDAGAAHDGHGADAAESTGSADGGAHGSTASDGSAGSAGSAGEAPSQALPITLGAAGLVAGLAGLGLGAAAYRRRS